MTARKITITGTFSEAELKRFVELLQTIDQEHPENSTYFISFASDLPLASVEDCLERVMGEVRPGYTRRITHLDY